MEIAIIALVCVNLVLLIIFMTRKGNGEGLETQIVKTLSEYQDRQKQFQSQEFQQLRESMERRLGDGLEKSRETLTKVLERLVRVDSAQKQISDLGQNVVDLQRVLTDKKSRGIFGEVQLNQILANLFGEQRGELYDLQVTLSNGKMVDAFLKLPEPLGHLAVDAKFPLENYQRMVDEGLDENSRKEAKKEFSKNMKKHIDDISGKYIIPQETSDQAVLFLPAEAIFAEVHAYHPEVIEYAAKKKVWLTSPTTLMAVLSTVQGLLLTLERHKHMDEIHLEINKLGEEFSRNSERWDDLVRHIGTIQKDVDKLQITNRKLSDRFKSIARL